MSEEKAPVKKKKAPAKKIETDEMVSRLEAKFDEAVSGIEAAIETLEGRKNNLRRPRNVREAIAKLGDVVDQMKSKEV